MFFLKICVIFALEYCYLYMLQGSYKTTQIVFQKEFNNGNSDTLSLKYNLNMFAFVSCNILENIGFKSIYWWQKVNSYSCKN